MRKSNRTINKEVVLKSAAETRQLQATNLIVSALLGFTAFFLYRRGRTGLAIAFAMALIGHNIFPYLHLQILQQIVAVFTLINNLLYVIVGASWRLISGQKTY